MTVVAVVDQTLAVVLFFPLVTILTVIATDLTIRDLAAWWRDRGKRT